jgi:hypothetical protein
MWKLTSATMPTADTITAAVRVAYTCNKGRQEHNQTVRVDVARVYDSAGKVRRSCILLLGAWHVHYLCQCRVCCRVLAAVLAKTTCHNRPSI